VIAKLLRTGNHAFISFYSKTSSLHFEIPDKVRPLAKRCAHVIYGPGSEGFRHSIDMFLLDNPDSAYIKARQTLQGELNTETSSEKVVEEDAAALARKYGLTSEQAEKRTDERYGVFYRIKQEFRGLERIIAKIARADIKDFYETRSVNPHQVNHQSRVEFFDEIIQPTILRDLGPAVLKKGTKALAHKELTSGQPFCQLHFAIDFTSNCRAYSELVQLGDGKNAYLFQPWDGCSYCYNRLVNMRHFGVGYHHADEKLLEEQLEIHKKDFAKKGIKTGFIRVGEGTENFIPELMDQVMALVEFAHKKKIPVVIPTKTPLYDKSIARILRKANVSLMISLGSDELETGICKMGFTNERRIEEAIRYHKSGVRAVLYPITDLTTHPKDNKLWTVRKAYQLNQEIGIPVQFLIFRVGDRKLLEKIADPKKRPVLKSFEAREELLIKGLEKNTGYFKPSDERNYAPTHIDQFYFDIIEHNMGEQGVCAVNPTEAYNSLCSNCFVPGKSHKNSPQQKIPLPNQEKLDQSKKERVQRRKMRELRRIHRFQGKLFEK
jgi:hypothetical protein